MIYVKVTIVSIVFYLIGSFPAAYLIIKKKYNKDITREESGNVGTLNAMKVSRSRWVGIIVLLIDFLKGALPVYFLSQSMLLSGVYFMIPPFFLLIGHNYPVWLKFKGGRGLASAAGMFTVINFFLVIFWCLFWLLVMLIKKDILIANFFATLFLNVPVIIFESFLETFTIFELKTLLIPATIMLTLVVLLKHFEAIKILINKET